MSCIRTLPIVVHVTNLYGYYYSEAINWIALHRIRMISKCIKFEFKGDRITNVYIWIASSLWFDKFSAIILHIIKYWAILWGREYSALPRSIIVHYRKFLIWCISLEMQRKKLNVNENIILITGKYNIHICCDSRLATHSYHRATIRTVGDARMFSELKCTWKPFHSKAFY